MASATTHRVGNPHLAKSTCRLLACAIAFTIILATACRSSVQEDEERLGRVYAAEVEKRASLVHDGRAERVERVGKSLAQVAREQEVPATYGSSKVCRFDYRFKVIEDNDANAFSLPGGRIYVDTGLLDIVASDDELAGVLAHEIAHAAHHHLTRLIQRQSSVDKYVALVALAGILGNMHGRDLNNVLMGAQMIKIGKLSSYTQEAEKDADRTAVAYMVRAGYNPEGLLTFMRKLEEKHQESPTLPLGIYQTHPASYRRVAAIARAMQEEGIDINFRQVADVACAKSAPAPDGWDRYQVVLNRKVLFEPAPLKCGTTSKERADQIAKRINDALDAKITCRDIRTDATRSVLAVREMEIVKVEPEDASDGETARAVLERARASLEYAVWADWLSTECAVALEPSLKD